MVKILGATRKKIVKRLLKMMKKHVPDSVFKALPDVLDHGLQHNNGFAVGLQGLGLLKLEGGFKF